MIDANDFDGAGSGAFYRRHESIIAPRLISPSSADRSPRLRHNTKRLRWRYVLSVPEDPTTQELKLAQLEREQAERRRARSAPVDDEAEQHDRRADKARYLAEKLEERAESERQQDG